MAPRRPRDPVERSKLIFDMLTGDVPNDKKTGAGRSAGRDADRPGQGGQGTGSQPDAGASKRGRAQGGGGKVG